MYIRDLQSAVGATPKDCRCRSLAFPSAADLFDVQTSFPKNNLYDSPSSQAQIASKSGLPC